MAENKLSTFPVLTLTRTGDMWYIPTPLPLVALSHSAVCVLSFPETGSGLFWKTLLMKYSFTMIFGLATTGSYPEPVINTSVHLHKNVMSASSAAGPPSDQLNPSE